MDGLARYQPDLVGFQELFNGGWAAEVKKKSKFPQFLFKDESGGLVLGSRFPVKEWGAETLSQSPLEEYSRYVLWAQLEVKKKKLFVFNTHFSWMLEDGASRAKQADDVLQLISEKAAAEEVVVMGDLNAPRRSAEIGGFVQKGGFRDLFFEAHPHDSGFTWNNRNPYVAGAEYKLPDRRIDFILTRGPGPLFKEFVSCDLVFTQPNSKGYRASDHYGVLAEFK